MSKVTMQDVADYARVSKATVSRVLNNNPTVNDELRNRIREAIVALGYQPNRAARRLRSQTSDVIGLIVSDIQNPYFILVTRGVEDAAYRNDKSIVLCNSDEDPTKLRMYLRVMQAEAVGGLIVAPAGNADAQLLYELQQSGMPIILLDRGIPGFQADLVKVDNENGARRAVSHLLSLGYRRIAIVQPDVVTGYERYQGYCQALQEGGLALDPSIVKVGATHIQAGYEQVYELMQLADRPEALFTATNLLTLGALRALRELRIRVPHDVALLGFDDMPWAQELYTPLTVVSQPTYDLGQKAVELLLRRVQCPDAPFETVSLLTELIVRESCGYFLRRGDRRHEHA